MSKKICKENSLLRQWRSQVSASGKISQTTPRSDAAFIFSANEIQLPHEFSRTAFGTLAHQKTSVAIARALQVISILSYHNTKAAGFRSRS